MGAFNQPLLEEDFAGVQLKGMSGPGLSALKDCLGACNEAVDIGEAGGDVRKLDCLLDTAEYLELAFPAP